MIVGVEKENRRKKYNLRFLTSKQQTNYNVNWVVNVELPLIVGNGIPPI